VPRPHSDLTLATILVTHDRLDHHRITLDRLLVQPVRPVVVVDNASPDGMADRLTLHRTRA
jgi:GT2 family glycosyltransferase